jgi:hypothetical protein
VNELVDLAGDRDPADLHSEYQDWRERAGLNPSPAAHRLLLRLWQWWAIEAGWIYQGDEEEEC